MTKDDHQVTPERIARARQGIADGEGMGGCPTLKARGIYRWIHSLPHIPEVAVEVGVFKGSSLSFIADAMLERNASAEIYGVDPYTVGNFVEQDVHKPTLDEAIRRYAHSTDFDAIHDAVVDIMRDKYGSAVRIVRQPSADAWSVVPADNERGIDFLHIDGNHDTVCVKSDIALFARRVRPGGIICMDDTDWPSVRAALPALDVLATKIEDAGGFAFYRRR